MSTATYKAKLTQIKSEIDALQEQYKNLEKEHPKNLSSHSRASSVYFKSRFPLKENWISQAFFHILALRFSKQNDNKIDKKEIHAVRNALTAILGLWEDDLGNSFLEFYENKLPVHTIMTNLGVAEHFRNIGYLMDKMEGYLSEKESAAGREQSAVLRLRYKFLMVFCNALNFKSLINDIEGLGETYSASKDILETLYTEFDNCIEKLWRHYFNNPNVKPNINEMQRSLRLIDFVKKLASFLLDKDKMLQYKKKYEVWNKYISKILDETDAEKVQS